MLKTVFKFIFMFIITAIVAIVAAGASYFLTKSSIENKVRREFADAAVTASTQSSPSSVETEPTAATAEFDFYIVRLEGDALGVYASFGGTEEFLYTENVYKNDLTKEDLSLLSSGVKLKNAEELTGFIENFTS